MANPLRKTMVYLGLADEDYDEPEQHEPAQHQNAGRQHHAPEQQHQSRAQVTPLRRASSVRSTAPELSEILTVHPRQYKDARAIAESFREGVPVVMNLSQMSEGDARRLIDFASGLSEGLYGRIERVTGKVFLLTPQHVAVSGDQAEAESDVDAGFFAAR